MKNLYKKAQFAISGEDGASMIEVIVYTSFILVIATVLFLFGDTIMDFLNKAVAKVKSFAVA